MGTAIKKGLEIKCLDSIRIVAGGADFSGEFVVDIIRVTRLGMETSRSVAYLATGIL